MQRMFHNHRRVEAVVFCVLVLPSRLPSHVTTSSSCFSAHLHCVSSAGLNCSSSCFAHLHCVSAAGLNCSSSCFAHLHCVSAAGLNCSSSCCAHLHCVSAAGLNCSSSCRAHLHCVSAAGLNCSSSCWAHLHCVSAAGLNCSSSCCAHLHCVSCWSELGAMYRLYDLDMLLQEDMLLTCIVECTHPMMCHIQILRCGHSTEGGHVAHLRCVLECSGSIPSWTFY